MLSAVGALAESEKRPWALQRRGRGTPLPSCPSLPALAVSGSLGTPASLFSTGVTSQAVFQVLWCPILTTFPSVGVKDANREAWALASDSPTSRAQADQGSEAPLQRGWAEDLIDPGVAKRCQKT
ncbi:putative zinc finger protein 840 [Manis javanica]|nr:putative zinc finger protein 840 [Manis javanica]